MVQAIKHLLSAAIMASPHRCHECTSNTEGWTPSPSPHGRSQCSYLQLRAGLLSAVTLYHAACNLGLGDLEEGKLTFGTA